MYFILATIGRSNPQLQLPPSPPNTPHRIIPAAEAADGARGHSRRPAPASAAATREKHARDVRVEELLSDKSMQVVM